MAGLFLVVAIAAQPALSRAESPPAVKTCPDGSIIRAADVCPVSFDHRYMMHHEPEMEIRATDWWCRGDRRPSVVKFRTRLHQRRDASGRSVGTYSTVELITLKVKGKPPSAATIRLVRQKLAPLNNIGYLHGRCLFRRSGGTQSVLTMNGYEQGRREPLQLEIEMEQRDGPTANPLPAPLSGS